MIGLMSLVKLLVVGPYECCAIDFACVGESAPKFGVVGTFANQSFNPMLIMHPKKNAMLIRDEVIY